jgi:hypothetical protein
MPRNSGCFIEGPSGGKIKFSCFSLKLRIVGSFRLKTKESEVSLLNQKKYVKFHAEFK